MYDSLDFVLQAHHAPNTDFLAELPVWLDNVSEHSFKDGSSIIGYCGGFRVTVTDTRVKIGQASLCKFYKGDNFQTLTRSDTQQAIELLSDTLHLPIERAELTRIDVAQNFVLKHPPELYLNHLGDLRYYKRLVQPTGLYYQNGKRQAAFYDKVKEYRSHRQTIPELYQNKNVLRYEIRYKKSLNAEFKRERVTGAYLYNEPFFRELIDRWAAFYRATDKVNLIQIDFSKMKTLKELRLASVADTVERNGGKLLFCQQIKAAQKRGELTEDQAKSFKKEVKVACTSKLVTVPSDLIIELDQAVEQGVELYR